MMTLVDYVEAIPRFVVCTFSVWWRFIEVIINVRTWYLSRCVLEPAPRIINIIILDAATTKIMKWQKQYSWHTLTPSRKKRLTITTTPRSMLTLLTATGISVSYSESRSRIYKCYQELKNRARPMIELLIFVFSTSAINKVSKERWNAGHLARA